MEPYGCHARAVQGIPALTRPEEAALAMQLQEGTNEQQERARQRLVEGALPDALAYARHLRPPWHGEFPDVLGEIHLAVVEAAAKYDGRAPFWPYAKLHASSRLHDLGLTRGPVRLPDEDAARTKVLRRVLADLRQTLGREPTVDELHGATGIGRRTLARMLAPPAVSLDQEHESREALQIADTRPTPEAALLAREHTTLQRQTVAAIPAVVRSLEGRTARVVAFVLEAALRGEPQIQAVTRAGETRSTGNRLTLAGLRHVRAVLNLMVAEAA